jgi:hypothetical protein
MFRMKMNLQLTTVNWNFGGFLNNSLPNLTYIFSPNRRIRPINPASKHQLILLLTNLTKNGRTSTKIRSVSLIIRCPQLLKISST